MARFFAIATELARHVLAPREGDLKQHRAAAESRRRVLAWIGIVCAALIVASGMAVIHSSRGSATTLPTAKRVIALGGEPRALALDARTLFVGGAEGRISELNSSSLSVIDRVPLHHHLRSVAAYQGIVYAGTTDGLVVAYPRGNAQDRRVRRVGPRKGSVLVAANALGVFAVDAATGRVKQLTSGTLRAVSRTSFDAPVADITPTPDGLWAALKTGGNVAFIAYDASGHHGGVRRIHGYKGPHALGIGAGLVWVASSDPPTLWAIDEKSKQLDASLSGRALPPGPSAVGVANGSTWVASAAGDRVLQFGSSSRRTVDVIRIGTGRAPVDLIVNPVAVWTANFADGTVARIDLQALGILHSLPEPVASAPAFKGVNRGVWVFVTAVLGFVLALTVAARWFEGFVLAAISGKVPKFIRPFFADINELDFLAGRRPIREVVTDEKERSRGIRTRVGAMLHRSDAQRTEREYDGGQVADLVQRVIADHSSRGKLDRDFTRLPIDDVGSWRRPAHIEPETLVEAMRKHHDRLQDSVLLIEGERWTLARVDDNRMLMTLPYIRSRDGQETITAPEAVHLTMVAAFEDFLPGRGRDIAAAGGQVACDVLAVVERRAGQEDPLRLAPVALYTPVADEVHLPARRRRSLRRGLGRRGGHARPDREASPPD